MAVFSKEASLTTWASAQPWAIAICLREECKECSICLIGVCGMCMR